MAAGDLGAKEDTIGPAGEDGWSIALDPAGACGVPQSADVLGDGDTNNSHFALDHGDLTAPQFANGSRPMIQEDGDHMNAIKPAGGHDGTNAMYMITR